MLSQPQGYATNLGDLGSQRMTALARRLGFGGDEIASMEQLFRELLAPWAHLPVGGVPPWPSDVSDDHSPFEFSVAIDGAAPELRMLVESRGEPATLASNEQWGLAVNERLRSEHGAQLERFERIRDLFLPADPSCVFAIWHAVCFWPGRPPEFKCYLNLLAQGAGAPARVAQEALQRLGFAHAWPVIARTALHRGAAVDRLMYFSLDLSPSPAPRVKVYTRHLDVTTAELEHACSGALDYQPGRITEFCRTVGGDDGAYQEKGPVTCLAFVDGASAQASASTIYFPIAAYAPNDRIARNRIASYLVLHELPFSSYVGPLEAFSTRPLDDGIGMQSYVSMRWRGDKPRVTVYLSPEACSVQRPR
ncbi:MAG: pyrroloquinoline quinone [bacterium]|nr:pyrroloquinoline quinone [bacterium]